MRAPFQILIIPFRRTATGVEFAVFKRSDDDYWQFVAGGGEDDETPLQAAQREMEEEVGIVDDVNLMPLDSMATVPKNCFAAAKSWPQNLYVVPEHCFAVNAEGHNFILSYEHTALQWIPYIEAWQKLKWDSNRNALWELNERLKMESMKSMLCSR